MAAAEGQIAKNDDGLIDYTPTAAKEGGDIVQIYDGRAGVVNTDLAASQKGSVSVKGIYNCLKTASVVVLQGAPMWWDHSANTATPIPPMVTGDKDFYLGVATEDAASSATRVKIAINQRPVYEIDTARDNGETALVLTAGTPNLQNRGGMLALTFSATAEAQKIDWLSSRTFPTASEWIAEFIVEVETNADADVADLSVGVANETHASDFQTVGQFATFHYDMGADLDLDAQSDDSSTDVAPTDTTIDWAEGTPLYLVLDGRDHTDVKYYVNGVEVLNATANLGKLTAATGPLKLCVHLEKSSNDSPGVVKAWGGLRFVGHE